MCVYTHAAYYYVIFICVPFSQDCTEFDAFQKRKIKIGHLCTIATLSTMCSIFTYNAVGVTDIKVVSGNTNVYFYKNTLVKHVFSFDTAACYSVSPWILRDVPVRVPFCVRAASSHPVHSVRDGSAVPSVIFRYWVFQNFNKRRDGMGSRWNNHRTGHKTARKEQPHSVNPFSSRPV